MVTNAGVSCSVHTWNDNLRDSLPHLNAAVTPETCSVYVAIEAYSDSVIFFYQEVYRGRCTVKNNPYLPEPKTVD